MGGPVESHAQARAALLDSSRVDFGRVRDLVRGAARAPGEVVRGASPEEIATLELRLARSLPHQLRQFLSVFNGARIGPGGFFGQRPDDPACDLPTILGFGRVGLPKGGCLWPAMAVATTTPWHRAAALGSSTRWPTQMRSTENSSQTYSSAQCRCLRTRKPAGRRRLAANAASRPKAWSSPYPHSYARVLEA